jgi:hypothetical protein
MRATMRLKSKKSSCPLLVDAEILQYQSEERLPDASDPLLWWKVNSIRFPKHSRLAITVLHCCCREGGILARWWWWRLVVLFREWSNSASAPKKFTFFLSDWMFVIRQQAINLPWRGAPLREDARWLLVMRWWGQTSKKVISVSTLVSEWVSKLRK